MRTFYFIFFVACSFTSIAQTFNSPLIAPYFENFDVNFNPGTGANNLGSTIDTSWFRDNYPWSTFSEYAWGGGTGTTPSNNTGPSSDHTSGNGNYVYAESSAFSKNRAKLTTPFIDLDTLSTPQLTFWKHQFGTDITSLSIQIVVNGFFGGTIYTSLGNQGNQWDKVTIPLTQYIGQTVCFIFVAQRNTTSPGNGLADIAIDDLEVQNAPICPIINAQFTDSTAPLFLAYSALTSSGAGLIYNWNFGDGTTDTGSIGTHTYASAGIYNVTLTVEDSCGQQDVLTKVITICDSGIGAFTYVQNGPVTTFDASNSVANGALSYNWDFGDGTSATGQVVNHTYTTSNAFNVVLTITNLCGKTYSKSQVVTLCANPKASWNYSIISSGSAGLAVQFSSQNTIGATNYLWDFGDGNVSSSPNPLHVYAVPSLNYVVTLIASNPCNQSDTLLSSLNSIGTNEANLEISTVFYPNPSKGLLFADLGGNAGSSVSCNVYDVHGKKIVNELVAIEAGRIALDLSSLQSGWYIIQLVNQTFTFQQKIIILD